MTDLDSSANRPLDQELRFDLDLVSTWHRASAAPSLVLIDWDRARLEHQVLAIDGKTAALRQLWDLRRDADYLRDPRRARKRSHRPRPSP